jgi:hypothetical protein
MKDAKQPGCPFLWLLLHVLGLEYGWYSAYIVSCRKFTLVSQFLCVVVVLRIL